MLSAFQFIPSAARDLRCHSDDITLRPRHVRWRFAARSQLWHRRSLAALGLELVRFRIECGREDGQRDRQNQNRAHGDILTVITCHSEHRRVRGTWVAETFHHPDSSPSSRLGMTCLPRSPSHRSGESRCEQERDRQDAEEAGAEAVVMRFVGSHVTDLSPWSLDLAQGLTRFVIRPWARPKVQGPRSAVA
jgi:hypothetical protein